MSRTKRIKSNLNSNTNVRGEHIPVCKNEHIRLTIDGLTHEGQGVGKYKGYTLFVKHALPGESVSAKVINTKKKYGFARLVEVIEPSPHRVEAPCPIFNLCGGCQLQHLDYAEQLRQKEQLVRDNLERIGGFNVGQDGQDGQGGQVDEVDQVRVLPTIGMKDPWRYRNKAQVPIGEEEGGLIGGFYRQGSHQIIDMEACLIQHERNDATVQKVKEIASELGISAYDETSHRGLLRHVVVKYGFATQQLMVVLITNGQELPRMKQLLERLQGDFSDLQSVVQNINTKRTNVIFGERSEVLWGATYIEDRIGDIRFAISAQSFYQVNPVQTEVLYERALEYAGLTGEETVIDAYCGIGTISLFLARSARRVLGVEVVEQAVEDARNNARLNGISNVHFEAGDAEIVMQRWRDEGVQADVIVVDPPRKGCPPALLATMAAMQPQRIVYVSCNPSTLARDLHILADRGYRVEEVQSVDMFPHTNHVECVTSLCLK